MQTSFIIFLGAGLGGFLRHCVSLTSPRFLNSNLPIDTLIVNILGSFIIGSLIHFFASKEALPQSWQIFLTTGLLGGFTTFSKFSLDLILLYQRGATSLALIYLLVSVVGSVLALLAGIALMRQFF